MLLQNKKAIFELYHRVELENGHFEDELDKSAMCGVRFEPTTKQYFENHPESKIDDRQVRMSWCSTSSIFIKEWFEANDKDLIKVQIDKRRYRVLEALPYEVFTGIDLLISEEGTA